MECGGKNMLVNRGFWLYHYLCQNYLILCQTRFKISSKNISEVKVNVRVSNNFFVSLQLSEHLGISMELGCFMAGVVLSSNGEDLVHKVARFAC